MAEVKFLSASGFPNNRSRIFYKGKQENFEKTI
jgi:hypothetical protein